MRSTGKLIGNKIVVTKPKDIGRLYSKSHFGRLISNKSLELDLLEASFLLDEDKIVIKKDKKNIDFESIVKLAAKKIDDFEIRYLVFKDLRKRGHSIGLRSKKEIATFSDYKDEIYIYVFSEKDFLKLKDTKDVLKITEEKGQKLWFGIVDEEGDITYYEVSMIDIKGNVKKHDFSKTKAFYFDNRVIIFDENKSDDLFEKEFFGKPFGPGLQLSIIEALYLLEKGTIKIESLDKKQIKKNEFIKNISSIKSAIKSRLFVFKDLKRRGLIVKTGFKFGADFRAYTKMPEKTHAEYLIYVVKEDFESDWLNISRSVRLAHSVNKEILFALISKKNIDYIKFGRLRP